MTASARVGWCPGALRPMVSGDGLLVRVKPHCATLSLAQAAGIAALAERCGNGHIDLTGRANLQVRGVSEGTLGELTAGLDRLGLLDPDPETEAVRNIVASPLAGLDPACRDIRPIVASIAARLAADPSCRLLPPKWSMLVDDGGPLSLDGVAADLSFVCRADGSVGVAFGSACAVVRAEQVADTLSIIAAVVARHRPTRMRDLSEDACRGALFAVAGVKGTVPFGVCSAPHSPHAEEPAQPAFRSTQSLRASFDTPASRAAQDEGRARALMGSDESVGSAVTPDRLLEPTDLFIGVVPRFGSVRAAELAGLVEAARRAGAHDLRLTPWRVLLVTTPVIARRRSRRGDPCGAGDMDRHASLAMTERKATLRDDLAALGFIVDAADPHLGIVACVGAPGCHRATVPTRADAARLAAMTRPVGGEAIHVSGCAKGCARPAAAAWTLVGRDGCYDLVRNGKAGDPPVARGLSFLAAAARVSGSGRDGAPRGLR